MTYTSIFGGSTIFPSQVSYLALSLDADTNAIHRLTTHAHYFVSSAHYLAGS